MKNEYTLQEIVDCLPILSLTNTDEDTFWYLNKSDDSPRFKHEEAKMGATFYDGNNGDKWKVVAINTEYKRMIVTNQTQGGERIVKWN